MEDTRTDSRGDKGTLTLKPYGKQTIFVYNQVNPGLMSHRRIAAELRRPYPRLFMYRPFQLRPRRNHRSSSCWLHSSGLYRDRTHHRRVCSRFCLLKK